MSRDVISACPVCSSEPAVTRLQCRGCGTATDGDSNVGRFERLSRELARHEITVDEAAALLRARKK